MPKNLVLCCDGTSNGFRADKTNVLRLVEVLESGRSQHLYYDPGVGTLPEPDLSSKLRENIRKWMSLGLGLGLDQNVEEAYTFLMNYWEPGDKVFLFGFSRGAYTVRVLAGMLHMLGLLPSGNENLVPYLLRMYGGTRDLGNGEDAEGQSKYWKLCNEFRGTFARTLEGQTSRRFPIHFVGAWDTVSSVGWFWEPRTYPYTFANPSIHTVRHAVSIDERRWFFRQNLFKRDVAGQDLRELWFPGSHCDVGGGYAEAGGGIWRVAFQWMVEEAAGKGLCVDQHRMDNLLKRPPVPDLSWTEKVNESLRSWWWLAEFFVPKWAYSARTKKRHIALGFGRRRTIPAGALFHNAVLHRLRDELLKYKPQNIDVSFRDLTKKLKSVPEWMAYTPASAGGGRTRQE